MCTWGGVLYGGELCVYMGWSVVWGELCVHGVECIINTTIL